MWVHQNPNILKCGRLTILEPTDVDGDKDPAEILKQLQAADPYEPRLKPLSEDIRKFINIYGIAPVGFLKKCWKIKVLGDSTDYNPLARDLNQKVNYGVIMIRSLVWHGLVTVIQVVFYILNYYMVRINNPNKCMLAMDSKLLINTFFQKSLNLFKLK